MTEKRTLERYSLKISARVKILTRKKRVEGFVAQTQNISSSGVFLSVDHQLSEGCKVLIDMSLPIERLIEALGEGHPVRVQVEGRVIRRCVDGIAVRFNRKYRFIVDEGADPLI